jgi:hypothetical protein
MKKIILLSAVLMLFFNARILAQPVTDDVIFNVDLQNLFTITVESGDVQLATVITAADYQNGVTPASGVSEVSVESTTDWYINISGPDLTGTAGTIPVNNIGVFVTDGTGSYTLGTEYTSPFVAAATCMGVTIANQLLVDVGAPTNAGGKAENWFNLNWLFGTMQGTMNATSLLNQIANGDFASPGLASTTLTLTATQY